MVSLRSKINVHYLIVGTFAIFMLMTPAVLSYVGLLNIMPYILVSLSMLVVIVLSCREQEKKFIKKEEELKQRLENKEKELENKDLKLKGALKQLCNDRERKFGTEKESPTSRRLKDEMENELSEQKEIIEALTLEIKTLCSEKEALKKDIENEFYQKEQNVEQELEKKIDMLDKERKELKKKVWKLHNENGELMKESGELTERIRQIEEENKKLCLELKGERKELSTVKSERDELVSQVEDYENKLQKAHKLLFNKSLQKQGLEEELYNRKWNEVKVANEAMECVIGYIQDKLMEKGEVFNKTVIPVVFQEIKLELERALLFNNIDESLGYPPKNLGDTSLYPYTSTPKKSNCTYMY